MLNKKMQAVYITIESVIKEKFPAEYLQFVLGGRIRPEDIIYQVLFECCKYAYDQTAEKHSLAYYIQNEALVEDNDAERMIRERTIQYINDRRNLEYKYLKSFGLDVEGLKVEKRQTIKEKLAGHELNSFQYWELNNVYHMRLVKAIVNKQISNKNFTTDKFKEYIAEYDDIITELHQAASKNDANKVMLSLVLFTLEWKYSVEFFYELASEMERNKLTKIPGFRNRVVPFCGQTTIISKLFLYGSGHLEGPLTTDSRLLLIRRKYVHDIVTASEDEFENERMRFSESIALVSAILLKMTYQRIGLREWFVNNTDETDWATVFETYNVHQVYNEKKVWSNKKIRYVKEMFDELSINYKNPEYRS